MQDDEIPEGYREIGSITPAERAQIDQTTSTMKDTFGALCKLMHVHQVEHHVDRGPCEIPCGSLDFYESLNELELNHLRQMVFVLVHDTVRMRLGRSAEDQASLRSLLKGYEGV